MASESLPRTLRFIERLPAFVGALTCVLWAAILVKSSLFPPIDDLDTDLLDIGLVGALLCASAMGVFLSAALLIVVRPTRRTAWIGLALSTAPFTLLLAYWGVRFALGDA